MTRRIYLFVISLMIVLVFGSCATIFNASTTDLNIITNKPGTVIVQGKKLIQTGTVKYAVVPRSREPLTITVYNDSLEKTVSVKSRNSVAYWLNIFPYAGYGIGMLIDRDNPKRYGYPRNIYIDLDKNDQQYLPFKPLDKSLEKYTNILKLTPLKMFGADNPSFEFSYEKKTSPGFSTQLMASYLLSNSVWWDGTGVNPNVKGYRFSVEERYFLYKSAPQGPYVSFEFNYLGKKFKVEETYVHHLPPGDSTKSPTSYSNIVRYDKQTYSFNFKFGYQIIKKRLALDFYVGIGPRYKDVKQYDRINPDDHLFTSHDINFGHITNQPGKYWALSIPLNFRVGWTF